jgi:hypothetical protein
VREGALAEEKDVAGQTGKLWSFLSPFMQKRENSNF